MSAGVIAVALNTVTDVVTAFAALAAVAGVAFALVQILDARRARDAQITADISRRWDEEPLLTTRRRISELGDAEAVRDHITALRDSHDPEYYQLLCEPNYFEDLAVLCQRKALDLKIIEESFGRLVSTRYDRWRLAVEYLRETDPKNYEHFEALAEKLRD